MIWSLALVAALPLVAPRSPDLDFRTPAAEVLRSRVVPLDASELERDDVRLPLFPDVVVEAVRDRVEPFGPESFVWMGHAAGDEESSIAISVSEGVLAGSVRLASGQFRIRPAGAGGSGLYRVDEVPTAGEPPDRQPLPVGPSRSDSPVPASADSGDTLDLLVVYTPRARMAAGGHESIASLVYLGVAETNLAFERSAIDTRLRLVELREVPYVEAGRVESDLEILQRDGDGALDEVHALRERFGADFVQLIVEEHDGCGISYSMGNDGLRFGEWAFSVVERGCVDSTFAMAHELGHNFGCDHAPEDPTTRGAFRFSHGYKDLSSGFRTIMAYGPGVRIPLFSTPRVRVRGLAAGTYEQDNARSIESTRETLARFRKGVPPPHLVRSQDTASGGTRFRLAPDPRGILEWRLSLGTSRGAGDLFDGGSRAASESTAAFSIPSDGRPLYARLWYRRGHVWLHDDFVL